jgi:hypothetical protein
MFDQSERSIWLNDSLWPKIRSEFGFHTLPEHGLFTVGYPSSGARGRSDKIKPAEINYQWTGNPNEPFAVFIHPVYFRSSEDVVKAIAFAAAKATRGNRWGAQHAGLCKHDDGTIVADATAQARIATILADVGEPPQGYGMPFPVREVQRARLRRYVCKTFCIGNGNGYNGKHPIIRAASDTLEVVCKQCGEAYQLD